MGVLNVTPDSFSDGGAWLDPTAAVAHGLALQADGADLVDVGGESTRPGAEPVSVAEECRRVLSVVGELARHGVAVSIDTTRAEVAAAALDAGAVLVNDTSGGRDELLVEAVAAAQAPYVLMHSRGTPADMQARASYDDVVDDVCRELEQRLARVVRLGVAMERVVLDPGLGFAKTAGHNLSLLAGLPRLLALGRPVLVGASRKSFLGSVLGDRPVDDREDATTAVTALAAAAGAWGVRVHAVRASADAVRVVAAIARSAT
jgi:dihydropteroate synthase